MKGLIKKVLVVVVLVATITVSYANEVSHDPNTDNLTRLTLANVTSGATLQIKDVNGLILYKEAIKENGSYSKEFDLTKLPDGNYYFLLDKTVEIVEIPFSVSKNEVIFDKADKKTIYKPMVYLNNKKMYVSKLSFIDDETIEILIYYENGDKVVHDMNINKKGTVLGRVYDFDGSEKGTYKVVVMSEGKQFTSYVNI